MIGNRLRHWISFVATGMMALGVDALILTVLTHWAGFSPFVARIPAIAVAMIVGWSSNRRFTFGIRTGPRAAEFVRYALASGAGSLVNYASFTAILLLWPGFSPLAALVLASGLAAGVSYTGYRFYAFSDPDDPRG